MNRHDRDRFYRAAHCPLHFYIQIYVHTHLHIKHIHAHLQEYSLTTRNLGWESWNTSALLDRAVSGAKQLTVTVASASEFTLQFNSPLQLGYALS